MKTGRNENQLQIRDMARYARIAALLAAAFLLASCGGDEGAQTSIRYGKTYQTPANTTDMNRITNEDMKPQQTAFSDTAHDSRETAFPAASKDTRQTAPTVSGRTGGASFSPYYDIEFHRGGRDARPENTLWSYQYALENGAATIECDMQMTKDGVLVLSHNPVLNPDITVDSEGRRIEADRWYINRMTLDELQGFNVGRMDERSEYYELHGRTQVQAEAQIPTLRELFELVRASGNGHIQMNIETKSYPDPALGLQHHFNTDMRAMVEAFYSLVREFGFEERVMLQSFDWSSLIIMREIDPSIRTVALYSEQKSWGTPDATTLWLDRDAPSPWLGGIDIRDYGGDPVRAAHALGFDVVSPYYEELDAGTVAEAHKFGMKVIPWTVNAVSDMAWLYELGVDGMISDRPWVLRAFLESVGERVPEKVSFEAENVGEESEELSPAGGEFPDQQPMSLRFHLEPDHYEVEDKPAAGGRDASH